jgi:hypothetical protein
MNFVFNKWETASAAPRIYRPVHDGITTIVWVNAHLGVETPAQRDVRHGPWSCVWEDLKNE